MGVLCEVYIADRKRALTYSFRGECKCIFWYECKCWNEFASETYDHIDNHRIYTQDFAQLLSILRGKKQHPDAVCDEFKMLKEFSDDGSPYAWIQKVPPDLPKLLAVLTTEELKPTSKKWAELLSENYREPVDKKLILDYLKLLHTLSQKSLKKRQSMYLWTGL